MTDAELGEMRAELRQLQKDVAEIKEHVNEVRDLLSQVRGGYRLMLWAGGVAAALASGTAWVWGFMRGSA